MFFKFSGMKMIIKCPKCGGELKIKNKRKISDKSQLIQFYCEHCNIYYEIIYRTVDEKEDKKSDELEKYFEHRNKITIEQIKKNKIWRYIETLEPLLDSTYFVYYKEFMARKPKIGHKITIEALNELGIRSQYAKKLVGKFNERGIFTLYEYQEKAFKKILEKKNVIIVAPTGTGKTEAFAIPSFERAKEIKESGRKGPIVLLIYPTKALAKDQLKKLKNYAAIFDLKIKILDGDTPKIERFQIIKQPPEILLTNFDMINYHLAKQTSLGRLFSNACIIIMDEVHQYSGAFGTHVHYILKRLRRLIEAKNRKLQIILASATIQNPKEFATKLVDDVVDIVEEKGRKTPLHIIFVYSRYPVYASMIKMLNLMLSKKSKILLFSNSRKTAELMYYFLKKRINLNGQLMGRVAIHRAGLSKEYRHMIEEKFRDGEILAIISTPTLELGIDIGDLDYVISEITPIDRFIQRSGRSGRRGAPGIALLLLRSNDPISEYYAQYPGDYFEDISPRVIEPLNPYIAKRHLYVFISEKPATLDEIKRYGIPLEFLDELLKEGAVVKVGNKIFADSKAFKKYFPANIRGASKNVKVFLDSKIIDERDVVLAIRELHPGAIYINRGRKFIVKNLDLKNLKAELDPISKDLEYFHTVPLYEYSAVPLEIPAKRKILGTTIFYVPLEMEATVYGYVLYKDGVDKPAKEVELDEPIRYSYKTYGIVFKAPPVDSDDEEAIRGAYHALEHVLIEGTNMITGGGSEDLGGISFGTTGIIVIYDGTPGGNGISSLLFERFEKAVIRALKILETCKCPKKVICNKCVYSFRCGNNNQPLNQEGALMLLRRMVAQENTPESEDALDLLKVLSRGIV